MADATNVNRGWYRYTADDGRFFAMKVGKGWGDSADSGFLAYGTGGRAFGDDPVFPFGIGRNRCRTITCQEAATHRTTRVRVGANTAEAWTNKAYEFVSGWKGIAGAATYKRISATHEHLLDAHAVASLAEATGV